jgi:hypothetical protein
MVFNLKLSPTVLLKKEDLEKLKALIKTYFSLGGMEIQFNVMTNKTLKAAKKNPEEYLHLTVRVSGFSAFFNSLKDELQNEITARTEHQMWISIKALYPTMHILTQMTYTPTCSIRSMSESITHLLLNSPRVSAS